MQSTTVAVDLAKDVIEIAVQGDHATERRRLSRKAFGDFLVQRPQSRIVMEACSGAHHWGRIASAQGHEVKLLPAMYVRAYRRRNKTDRADCSALLEAAKNPEILPVAVKSIDSQVVLSLHRIRSQWMATRTARINNARGLLREFGIVIPQGAQTALKRIPEALESVPPMLRAALNEILDEIHALEGRVKQIELQLAAIARDNAVIQRVMQVSGIGLLTGTALVASAGDAKNFRSGRHLASWLGLTPREHSSGSTRHLGRMSKRGDVYLRMLLTHGARAVLLRAGQLQRSGRELSYLQRWALQVKDRVGQNKATCALANKLARIAWATWRYERDFDPNHAAQQF